MNRKSVRSQKMSALTKRVHKGLGTGLGASFQEVSALVHCPLVKAAPYFPIKKYIVTIYWVIFTEKEAVDFFNIKPYHDGLPGKTIITG